MRYLILVTLLFTGCVHCPIRQKLREEYKQIDDWAKLVQTREMSMGEFRGLLRDKWEKYELDSKE